MGSEINVKNSGVSAGNHVATPAESLSQKEKTANEAGRSNYQESFQIPVPTMNLFGAAVRFFSGETDLAELTLQDKTKTLFNAKDAKRLTDAVWASLRMLSEFDPDLKPFGGEDVTENIYVAIRYGTDLEELMRMGAALVDVDMAIGAAIQEQQAKEFERYIAGEEQNVIVGENTKAGVEFERRLGALPESYQRSDYDPATLAEIDRLQTLKPVNLEARKAIGEGLIEGYRNMPSDLRLQFGDYDPEEYPEEFMTCVDLDNIGFLQATVGLNDAAMKSYAEANACWKSMGKFDEMTASAVKAVVQQSYLLKTKEERDAFLGSLGELSYSIDATLNRVDPSTRIPDSVTIPINLLDPKSTKRLRSAQAELFATEARILLADLMTNEERMAQFETKLKEHIRKVIDLGEVWPVQAALLLDASRFVQAPHAHKARIASLTTHDANSVRQEVALCEPWYGLSEELYDAAMLKAGTREGEVGSLDQSFSGLIYSNRFNIYGEGGLPLSGIEAIYKAYTKHPENRYLARQIDDLREKAPNLFNLETGELLPRDIVYESSTAKDAEYKESTLHYNPATVGETVLTYGSFGISFSGLGALVGSFGGPGGTFIGGGLGSIVGEAAGDVLISCMHSDKLEEFYAEARATGTNFSRVSDKEANRNYVAFLDGKIDQYVGAGIIGAGVAKGTLKGVQKFARRCKGLPKLVKWLAVDVVWVEAIHQTPRFLEKILIFARATVGWAGGLRGRCIDLVRSAASDPKKSELVLDLFKRVTGRELSSVEEVAAVLSKGAFEEGGVYGYRTIKFTRALRAVEKYGLEVIDEFGSVIPSKVAEIRAGWVCEVLKRQIGFDLRDIKVLEDLLAGVTKAGKATKDVRTKMAALFKGLSVENRNQLVTSLINSAAQRTLKGDKILVEVLKYIPDTVKKNIVRAVEAVDRYGLAAIDSSGKIVQPYVDEVVGYFKKIYEDGVRLARPSVRSAIEAEPAVMKARLFSEWADTVIADARKVLTKISSGYSRRLIGQTNRPLNAVGNFLSRCGKSYVDDGLAIFEKNYVSNGSLRGLSAQKKLKRHLSLLDPEFIAKAERSQRLGEAWSKWLGGIRNDSLKIVRRVFGIRTLPHTTATVAKSSWVSSILSKSLGWLGNEQDWVGFHRWLALPASFDFFFLDKDNDITAGDFSFDHLWGFLAYSFALNHAAGSIRINDVLAADIASLIKNGTYAFMLNSSGNSYFKLNYNTLATIHALDYTALNPFKLALASGHDYVSKVPVLKIFSEIPLIRRLPSLTSLSRSFLPSAGGIWEQWSKPAFFGLLGRAANLFTSAGIIGWGVGFVTGKQSSSDQYYKAHRSIKMILWGLIGEPLQYSLGYLTREGQAKGRTLGVLFDIGVAILFPPFHNKGLGMEGVKEDLEDGTIGSFEDVWDAWKSYNTSLDFGGVYDRVLMFGDSLFPTGVESKPLRFFHTRWEPRYINAHWLARIEGDDGIPEGTEWSLETIDSFCRMFTHQIYRSDAEWYENASEQDGLMIMAMIVKYYADQYDRTGLKRYEPFYNIVDQDGTAEYWKFIPTAFDRDDLLEKIRLVDEGIINSADPAAVMRSMLLRNSVELPQ